MIYNLQNVYFIWGKGKTTIANTLNQKYGFYVYGTDEARDRLMSVATPEKQPNMCRDWEKEYGVNDFWELPPEVIAEREKHFLYEMTPLILKELSELSNHYDVIICEGDIDYSAVSSITPNSVFLHTQEQIDFFDRPDHCHMLDSVKKRTDISQEDKEKIIESAYKAVSSENGSVPEWVSKLGITVIQWDHSIPIEATAEKVEKLFNLAADVNKKSHKILLTSNGLETELLENTFLDLIEKEPQKAKILFIPTAATYADAVLVLPKCMNDLLRVGIHKENIVVYDIHSALSEKELEEYDAIYFTGGDPSYLLQRINDSGFRHPLVNISTTEACF